MVIYSRGRGVFMVGGIGLGGGGGGIGSGVGMYGGGIVGG